jgi:hypothetical protein
MIKTNKADFMKLCSISSKLSSGLDLLMSSKFELMTPSKSTTTDIFTAPYYKGESYCKVTKDIGNDLVPMFTAIIELRKLLSNESLTGVK